MPYSMNIDDYSIFLDNVDIDLLVFLEIFLDNEGVDMA
jgi:L-rhamnose mutarotase